MGSAPPDLRPSQVAGVFPEPGDPESERWTNTAPSWGPHSDLGYSMNIRSKNLWM